MDYSKDNNEKKLDSHKSKKKKIKNKAFTIVLRVFVISLLVTCFAAVGTLVGVYVAILQDAPSLSVLEASIAPRHENSIVIEARTGLEIDRFVGMENREYVPLSQIPQNLINAFVSIEDERFFSHSGVDLRGTLRAVHATLTTPYSQGGSTITQQLIKNNVFQIMQNDVKTKLQEQYLAIQYENLLIEQLGSKQEAKNHILELYLNTIGLHRGSGVQAASLRYFDKDVSELTLSESAVIAAITQRPVFFDPVRNPENNRVRQSIILQKMYEQGFITAYERDEALADDVYSRISATNARFIENTSFHSYFVDLLYDELVRDLQERLNYSFSLAEFTVFNGGLTIYATIDTDMQAIVDEAYMNDALFPARDYEIAVTYRLSKLNTITGETTHHEVVETIPHFDMLDALEERLRNEMVGPDDEIIAEIFEPVVQPQSAMVIMDHATGQVKALSGGRGDKLASRVLNRASASPRQPGSVFKILASFAPALDLGIITPATVYDDIPFEINGYSPNNWYRNPPYRGLSSVREAIRDSMNVVTVQNFVATGADNIFEYLLNFGFTTLADDPADNNGRTDRIPSTSLGGVTHGVTMLELAGSFASIANNGQYIQPHLYTHVLDRNGDILLENVAEPRQVLKPTTAYLLTDMMKDVINPPGTGVRARFQSVNMPVAGKTGTTSDTRDLVFAGYTPYYTASIYLGHDMPKTITDQTSYHLQLWRHVMEEIHKDLPHKEFIRPDGIVSQAVCRISGLLPIPGLCDQDPRGSMIRTELFAAGTQPTEYCNIHQSVVIDVETGYLANEYCPEENKRTIVGIVRPVPFTGSAVIADAQYELSRLVAGYGTTTCPIHDPDFVPVMPEDEDELFEGEYNELFPDDLIITDPPDGSDDSNSIPSDSSNNNAQNNNSDTQNNNSSTQNNNSDTQNNNSSTQNNNNAPPDTPESNDNIIEMPELPELNVEEQTSTQNPPPPPQFIEDEPVMPMDNFTFPQ